VGKLSLASQELERLQDAFDESLGGVRQAARVGEDLLQVVIGRDQPVVVGHVRVLGELGRDGMHKLWNGAAALVVL